jgi:3-hydroxyisobutyrate dehydrogenase-like beta-hydroxyacid dehydrogenase
MDLVDAPLSRTPVEAEAGRLNVMVGAEPARFAQVEPLLKCFAENVFHVGGPGAGHTIKLLNNFIAQAICTATAEAFAVGTRAGVDLRQLVSLVSMGPVNCGLFQAMAQTLDGQMDGLKFALDNARKDVRYYTHLAENQGTPSLVGEAVHQSLALASALGHGSKFVPSLVEAQEQLAHVRIRPT